MAGSSHGGDRYVPVEQVHRIALQPPECHPACRHALRQGVSPLLSTVRLIGHAYQSCRGMRYCNSRPMACADSGYTRSSSISCAVLIPTVAISLQVLYLIYAGTIFRIISLHRRSSRWPAFTSLRVFAVSKKSWFLALASFSLCMAPIVLSLASVDVPYNHSSTNMK